MTPDWLDRLRRIGLDEVSYRKGRHDQTCVVDHDTGRIVWAQPGRSQRVVHAFFDELGPERTALLEAVSCDLHGMWRAVIERRAPQARICADPLHVVRLATEALETLRRRDWQRLRRTDLPAARWLKGTRFILRRRADGLSDRSALTDRRAGRHERAHLPRVAAGRPATGRLPAPTPHQARLLLDEWLYAAPTSRLEPFMRVAIAFEEHAEAIVNEQIARSFERKFTRRDPVNGCRRLPAREPTFERAARRNCEVVEPVEHGGPRGRLNEQRDGNCELDHSAACPRETFGKPSGLIGGLIGCVS